MMRILILVAALVSGGIAAWFAMTLQPQAAAHSAVSVPVPNAPVVEVLVAASPLSPGQPLTPEALRWQAWPQEGLEPNLLTREDDAVAVEELTGAIVRSAFIAGEPIRREKLADANSGFLASILPTGKRAVAVRISAESSAGGFVLPNDHVDVVHTTARPASSGSTGGSVSQTILRNIRVLAIDQIVQDNESGKTAVGKTATLELDPAQVEVLAAAESSGVLSLALRSMADSGAQALDAVPQLVAAAEPAPSAERTITMIRSGRSQVVTIRSSARN